MGNVLYFLKFTCIAVNERSSFLRNCIGGELKHKLGMSNKSIRVNYHCEMVAKLMFQVLAICQSILTKGSNPAA